MATSLVDRVGFGIAVDSSAIVDGSAALGTTPQKVTMPDITAGGGGSGYIKVKIVNPNPTAVLAWKLVTRGATAPVFGATFAANEGSHVLAGQVEYITIPTSCDLYVVASVAATSWSSTAQLIR